MATTIEELEKRVSLLEGEVRRLEHLLDRYRVDETPAARGARHMLESRLTHDQAVAAWDKAMKEMGVEGEPVGVERLRAMMIAEGINPADSEFSREIIKMREE